ncbi:dihydrofolate reductase [Parashewanella curva]|uniref:Dihydrofolate reductase n=1 Tax=Parashewanella curva TaxID=2338552 RepID=A0A3L8PXE7_9GAMM|nr:dihydrofolate reductase family protein [Parashewanella curva]RLV60001.1 dihydrofolate reductase [Parashewanella curva]
MANIVFIATSLDGYIADKNRSVDWLHTVPNPDNLDMGFDAHMERIDALIMGRNTMELVLSFDCDWPYNKPVFVLSNTLEQIPSGYEDKIQLIKGELSEIIKQLKLKGYEDIYIDGGITIQQFLKQDLIDEMLITTIPIVLGGGIPLFAELAHPIEFRCVESIHFNNGVGQNRFVRYRGSE